VIVACESIAGEDIQGVGYCPHKSVVAKPHMPEQMWLVDVVMAEADIVVVTRGLAEVVLDLLAEG